jgi:hypothetical protein
MTAHLELAATAAFPVAQRPVALAESLLVLEEVEVSKQRVPERGLPWPMWEPRAQLDERGLGAPQTSLERRAAQMPTGLTLRVAADREALDRESLRMDRQVEAAALRSEAAASTTARGQVRAAVFCSASAQGSWGDCRERPGVLAWKPVRGRSAGRRGEERYRGRSAGRRGVVRLPARWASRLDGGRLRARLASRWASAWHRGTPASRRGGARLPAGRASRLDGV